MAGKGSKPYIREELVAVGESPVHGKGLFAVAPIEEGTELGRCKGKVASKDGPHVLWIDEDTGIKVKCDLRFINHHSAPNVVYFDDLTVVALRDISPGEELLHHYGDEWE